ncbi:hypothetical protein SNEBB_001747 [Seison nebaliae]|nr:hypothetical protein SNEBB_001747 [Seison nebaliae]
MNFITFSFFSLYFTIVINVHAQHSLDPPPYFTSDLSLLFPEIEDDARAPRAPIDRNAYLEEIEMSRIDKLDPNIVLQKTREVINDETIPIVINPGNLVVETRCNKADMSNLNGKFDDYVFKKVLGQGVQGIVIQIRKGYEHLALKYFSKTTDYIMQLNSMLAYGEYFTHFQVKGVAQGELKLRRTYEKFSTPETTTYIDLNGHYCMTMNIVEGRQLVNQPVSLNLIPSWKKEHIKKALRFIILSLRQLQILHFTFNRYGIFFNYNILRNYTFTLFHGDIHGGNILMVAHPVYGRNYPQFIDIGFALNFLLHKETDVYTLLYNRFLLRTSLIRSERAKNIYVVHKNQLLNSLQVMDLCMFWIVMINNLLKRFTAKETNMRACFIIQEYVAVHAQRKTFLNNLYILFNRNILWPVFREMALFSSNIQSYEGTWGKLYQLLRPP